MDKFTLKLRNIHKSRMKPKRFVSIITRAYNRLEYTIQCVNAVRENTVLDYEHIIINNNSNDGTSEWLDWITSMPNGWYDRVGVVHMTENVGDWGGMVIGAGAVSPGCSYIAQLDNDILVPPRWLSRAVGLLEVTGMNVVMLKRIGVQTHIRASNIRRADVDGVSLEFGDIGYAVACWVARAELFANVGEFGGCKPFTKACGGVVKVLNLECRQIDGWDPVKRSYVQHEKYLPYKDHVR